VLIHNITTGKMKDASQMNVSQYYEVRLQQYGGGYLTQGPNGNANMVGEEETNKNNLGSNRSSILH
jgi:hypothetical protein